MDPASSQPTSHPSLGAFVVVGWGVVVVCDEYVDFSNLDALNPAT